MTRTERVHPPRIYFSFRSPYSWLAVHDLTTKHPEVVSAAQWIPFWEPDEVSERMLTDAGGRFIYTPMSREKHRYMLRDVRRLTAARGLTVTWPIDRDPWWEVSHLAYLVAAEQGRDREFMDRVYRARWEQGRDISDRATIADLAVEAGVSRPAVEQAVDDERVRRLGVDALLAMHHDDVFGVPFFIHRSEKFWGVDRIPAFLDSLGHRQGGERAEPDLPVTADPGAGDQGHAGGCG